MLYDYRPIFYPAVRTITSNPAEIYEFGIILRRFLIEEQVLFLFINPQTMVTNIVPVEEIFFRNPMPSTDKKNSLREDNSHLAHELQNSHYISWEHSRKSNYIEALYRFTEIPATLASNGLSHATKNVDGFFLTVDMCPSVNPTEKDFFQMLVDLIAKRKTPFPVAISMTGAWIEKHNKDFNWLIEQKNNQKLDIIWVNHSYSHFYLLDLVNQENFILNPFTDLTLELFETEKTLIKNGQTPSAFFRFSGLISDSKTLELSRKYGFIPLGADAWLAKQQKPTNGSIILVHGNGNEHQGIIDIMPILKEHDPEGWLPINAAICS